MPTTPPPHPEDDEVWIAGYLVGTLTGAAPEGVRFTGGEGGSPPNRFTVRLPGSRWSHAVTVTRLPPDPDPF